MTELTDSQSYVAVEETLSTTLDGESVILHTGSGTYYGFNDVGTKIWESLDQPRSIDDLTRDIAEQYDVTSETCRQDIEQLLDDLIEKDLVERVEE